MYSVPKRVFDLYRIKTYDPFSPISPWKEFVKMMSSKQQKQVAFNIQSCGVSPVLETNPSKLTVVVQPSESRGNEIGSSDKDVEASFNGQPDITTSVHEASKYKYDDGLNSMGDNSLGSLDDATFSDG